MSKINLWLDGVCKKCGSFVIETDARWDNSPEAEEVKADYKNTCLNPNCDEHHWHYVGDMEEAEYYIHSSKLCQAIVEAGQKALNDLEKKKEKEKELTPFEKWMKANDFGYCLNGSWYLFDEDIPMTRQMLAGYMVEFLSAVPSLSSPKFPDFNSFYTALDEAIKSLK